MKTLALRSFQIIQDTSITAVSSSFLCSFDSPCRRRSHHSKRLRPARDGEFWIPRTESRVCQNLPGKAAGAEQMVSRLLFLVAQPARCIARQPTMASPVQVQMRCLTANHIKNFTFCGAQVSKSGLLPQSGWCLGKTLGSTRKHNVYIYKVVRKKKSCSYRAAGVPVILL